MLPNWLYGKSKSKLASILGGGGGTPADYNQVKAQVNQNTQDITGLLDNLEVNGVVNMLPNNATTQVLYGVTLTVNSDDTFTANGTASASINYNFATITGLSGRYRLTGCPSGGSGEGYQLQIQDGSTYIEPGDYGSGIDYLFDSSKTYNIRFVVRSGKTLNNLTFKPMISLTSLDLSYDDYVPPAKSNRELTEELSEDSANVTENGITASFRKWGKVCTVAFSGAFNADFAYDTTFLNIPSGFTPNVNYQMLSTNKPASVQDRIALNIVKNGTINVSGQNVVNGDKLRGSFTYITA